MLIATNGKIVGTDSDDADYSSIKVLWTGSKMNKKTKGKKRAVAASEVNDPSWYSDGRLVFFLYHETDS